MPTKSFTKRFLWLVLLLTTHDSSYGVLPGSSSMAETSCIETRQLEIRRRCACNSPESKMRSHWCNQPWNIICPKAIILRYFPKANQARCFIEQVTCNNCEPQGGLKRTLAWEFREVPMHLWGDSGEVFSRATKDGDEFPCGGAEEAGICPSQVKTGSNIVFVLRYC